MELGLEAKYVASRFTSGVISQNLTNTNTNTQIQIQIWKGRDVASCFTSGVISQNPTGTPSELPAGPIQSAPNCDSFPNWGNPPSHP